MRNACACISGEKRRRSSSIGPRLMTVPAVHWAFLPSSGVSSCGVSASQTCLASADVLCRCCCVMERHRDVCFGQKKTDDDTLLSSPCCPRGQVQQQTSIRISFWDIGMSILHCFHRSLCLLSMDLSHSATPRLLWRKRSFVLLFVCLSSLFLSSFVYSFSKSIQSDDHRSYVCTMRCSVCTPAQMDRYAKKVYGEVSQCCKESSYRNEKDRETKHVTSSSLSFETDWREASVCATVRDDEVYVHLHGRLAPTDSFLSLSCWCYDLVSCVVPLRQGLPLESTSFLFFDFLSASRD